MVTHDPLAAERAGRILHLDKGKLVRDESGKSPASTIGGGVMKYLTYVLRNARRSPVRSLLTIGSTDDVPGLLMMILLSFLSINDSVASPRGQAQYNRLIVMSSQGFTQPVPITSRLARSGRWTGSRPHRPSPGSAGSTTNETMPFAQFGVDAGDVVLQHLRRVQGPPSRPAQGVQGRPKTGLRRSARSSPEERKIKIGDPLPLKGDGYPFDLKLTVRAIYDGPGPATGGCASSTGTTSTRSSSGSPQGQPDGR